VTAVPSYGEAVSPVPPPGEADRFGAGARAEFAEFDTVAAALRAAMEGQRAELSLRETPGPTKLAPRSLAVLASVRSPHAGHSVVTHSGNGDDEATDEIAVGRLVLLHDPAGQAAWDGTFRIAVFARADLDPEMGADPMLPEVTWSWLEESLAASGATADALGGTVTVTRSSRFGALVEADDEGSSEVELRCSWTPRWDDEPGRHLQAFGDMLCDLAGLPPDLPGVVAFTARRR
jgi:hypothetical protein